MFGNFRPKEPRLLCHVYIESVVEVHPCTAMASISTSDTTPLIHQLDLNNLLSNQQRLTTMSEVLVCAVERGLL